MSICACAECFNRTLLVLNGCADEDKTECRNAPHTTLSLRKVKESVEKARERAGGLEVSE